MLWPLVIQTGVFALLAGCNAANFVDPAHAPSHPANPRAPAAAAIEVPATLRTDLPVAETETHMNEDRSSDGMSGECHESHMQQDGGGH